MNANLLTNEEFSFLIKKAKKEAVKELLELHKQDRANVNSQCDSLINMSTVEKYLRSLW